MTYILCIQWEGNVGSLYYSVAQQGLFELAITPILISLPIASSQLQLFFLHILAMKYLLLFLLLQIALSSVKMVVSSNLETTILTPGYFTALANFHNVYQNQYLGPGTFWIWNNQGNASPIGRSISFQSLFYLNCNGPVTLNLTADQSFTAYLDGKIIAQGDNYVKVYSIPLSAKCGSHNLTITVVKGSSALGPALIFAVFQDQSGCFNCNQNGQWNDNTCSCSCVTVCGCDSDKVWVAYPTCACICLQTIPNLEQYLSKLDNQTKSIEGIKLPASVTLKPPSCPVGQRYSQGVCGCICKPRFCIPNFQWNSNPNVCQCQRIAN